jgi:hypothetical protein
MVAIEESMNDNEIKLKPLAVGFCVGLVVGLMIGLLAGAKSTEAAAMTGSASAWARASPMHVPGPAGPEITINFGSCPGLDDASACWMPWVSQIWLTEKNEFDLMHELGHVFDARNLDAMERKYLRPRIMLGKAWDDCGEVRIEVYGACPKERFADAYANCALGYSPSKSLDDAYIPFASSYGYRPTRKHHHRICELIKAFADPA